MHGVMRIKLHRSWAICLLAWGLLAVWPSTTAALIEEEVGLLRQTMVERINSDRALEGLAPVELDELASEVGTAHCQDMVEAGYFSHWNRQGLKPYQRYSLAGGTHYVAENLYQCETTGTLDTSFAGIRTILLSGHEGFMAEGPEGGHRKNILDPFRTHVGIGFAFSQKSLRMAQEFLNEYVTLELPPAAATLNQQVLLEGHITADGRLASVTIFHEPLPQPMTFEQLSETEGYFLPDERKDLFPVLPPGWYYMDGGTGEVTLKDDGGFSFGVSFFAGEGAYTVVVWVELPDGSSAPATSFTILASENKQTE